MSPTPESVVSENGNGFGNRESKARVLVLPLLFIYFTLFFLSPEVRSCVLFFNFFDFFGPHPRHMEVPRLGV